MERRRRTDHLPAVDLLPTEPIARARMACDALNAIGMQAACALHVGSSRNPSMLCAGAGRVDHVIDAAQGLAAQVADSGRALQLMNADDPAMGVMWRFGAMPCGTLGDGQVVVVVADPSLTQREAQSIATWIAPGAAAADPGTGTGALARALARDFNADAIVFALFAQAGMLLSMHVRSGAVLRTWRCPVDTVWGEAARHAAAFMLGDLHMHPGAESLSSLSLRSAAVVGIENGSGVAVGSIGIASGGMFDVDVAQRMLERAGELGQQLMSLRASTPVPRADADGAVALRAFAARVGCRRFAMYCRQGQALTMVAAHAEDGSVLVSAPDPYEEQLVLWAAEKGVAVASDDAAAVMVGDDTVLYAQDPNKRPMECLRLALQDLRSDPYGRAA